MDFSKKYDELTGAEKDALKLVGQEAGWKQSKRAIENGKPYTESYYSSLRRAWNAVSGVQGVGRAYDVRDADGNVCLTWIEDAAAHVQAETPQPEPETVAPKPKAAPKPKKQSKKDAEDMQRANFASMFIRAYMDNDGWAGVKIDPEMVRLLNRDFTQNGQTVKIGELFIWAWGNKKYKIHKRDNNVRFINMLDGKEYSAPLYRQDGKIFEILDEYYKLYIEDAGWREHADELDDIRIALLNKAKHMHVSVPYDKRDEYADLIENSYIRGDNRYKALELINWIMYIHQHYDVGGDTYYPMYSYDTKEQALSETGGKMKGNGFKIIPVWEVPIEQITGIRC